MTQGYRGIVMRTYRETTQNSREIDVRIFQCGRNVLENALS